ncbi:MAG: ComEA family DNA-binding protein [Pyrinomonadaceae bacterium]
MITKMYRGAAAILFALVLMGCSKPDVAGREGDGSQTASAGKIDINTASAKELERLPGVGEHLALRIVQHRDANGPFRRVEEIMLVPGFSDKRFRTIRSMITVDRRTFGDQLPPN